jgi:hypothetical protein
VLPIAGNVLPSSIKKIGLNPVIRLNMKVSFRIM